VIGGVPDRQITNSPNHSIHGIFSGFHAARFRQDSDAARARFEQVYPPEAFAADPESFRVVAPVSLVFEVFKSNSQFGWLAVRRRRSSCRAAGAWSRSTVPVALPARGLPSRSGGTFWATSTDGRRSTSTTRTERLRRSHMPSEFYRALVNAREVVLVRAARLSSTAVQNPVLPHAAVSQVERQVHRHRERLQAPAARATRASSAYGQPTGTGCCS